MHIIPFCVKIALSTTHIAVCISHDSKYCARILYTRMFTRQFFNDSCSTSRVSNMQHSSKIKHAAQLGYRTCNTSRISNTCNQSIRWIAQMLNSYFDPFKMRDTMQGLYAMQVLCGTYTQGRFCTGPQCGLYTRPLRNAGFARDLSNTASFLRPFTMLAETSRQTNLTPQIIIHPQSGWIIVSDASRPHRAEASNKISGPMQYQPT